MTTAALALPEPAVASAGAPVARVRVLSRPLLAVFAADLGAMTSFYVLLSVLPVYATSVGVAGSAAGLATGALMLTTVLAELATPRLVARVGYRWAFALALVLLGAPALALPAVTSVAGLVTVSAVRGVGFGIVVVVVGALVVLLLPAERRGEGLGLYGVVAGAPSVVALPAGLWLGHHVGYSAAFVAAALSSLAGLLVVAQLPGRVVAAGPAASGTAGLRLGLRRPATVFAATTLAAGAVVTFLPLAVTGADASVVSAGLLVHAVVATLARWWSGTRGDRHGFDGQLVPALVVSAAGLLLLGLTGRPVAVLAGMVLFGAGFGVVQGASLALMFARAPRSAYDAVSAVWSLAYDAGFGAGAAGFGLLAGRTGYGTAFAVLAAVILLALRPARRCSARC